MDTLPFTMSARIINFNRISGQGPSMHRHSKVAGQS